MNFQFPFLTPLRGTANGIENSETIAVSLHPYASFFFWGRTMQHPVHRPSPKEERCNAHKGCIENAQGRATARIGFLYFL
jgi:hypothetical protein